MYWRCCAHVLLCLPQVLDVMRCVLLCTLEAAEGGLCGDGDAGGAGGDALCATPHVVGDAALCATPFAGGDAPVCCWWRVGM